MKGIILSAGKGTRLYPMTRPICKPLLPVYDKPMLYYPLAALIAAGIRDVLIIVPPDDESPFRQLLGDGSQLGMRISYLEQKVQRGIADAFLIGETFIGGENVCLILGDNIFYGKGFRAALHEAMNFRGGAAVFGCLSDHPQDFGVVEFDAEGRALSIEEKPQRPKSDYIVPGLYFYDGRVSEIAKNVKPSARGELEITSVNNAYLEMGELRVHLLERDFSWFDTGTAESLITAAEAVRTAQRGGSYIGCVEEAAFRNGWIGADELQRAAESMPNTAYGAYLQRLAER